MADGWSVLVGHLIGRKKYIIGYRENMLLYCQLKMNQSKAELMCLKRHTVRLLNEMSLKTLEVCSKCSYFLTINILFMFSRLG